MKRAAFLDQPGMHIVTQRTGQPLHDYANPITHTDRVTENGLSVILVCVIVLLIALALVNVLSR